MCGISGVTGNFTQEEGREILSQMLRSIEHRGPDDQGSWSTKGIAIGMRRLSIIDLSGGHQPIWDDSGVGIVFNGEIYNYLELRKNLEESGAKFKTKSDTEVILRLYLDKGMSFLNELNGMFGICIYDPRSHEIILARDRLGIKPLYYLDNGSQFAFASEIKAFQPLNVLKELNSIAVSQYLNLRYVHGPETIWKGIHKLPPGHYGIYSLKTNSFNISKYWDFSFKSVPESPRNYQSEFESLFLDAVNKRLVASDVPVGILLSGGLDSSCVAAAACELGHKNFHTFSVGFEEGGDYSELAYAREVAEHIGSEHHEIVINQNDFISFLEDFTWFSDEPLADLASVPLYFVSKLAVKHVKVVLAGEGADEILSGYNFDSHARMLSLLKMASFLPKQILHRLPVNTLKNLAHNGYSNFHRAVRTHITNIFSPEEIAQLTKGSDSLLSANQIIEDLYTQAQSPEPLDQIQEVYCKSWLVEDLLMKADKMSMANSLELRVPFLDHRLLEWASKLPQTYKVGSLLRGYTTKKILRDFASARLPQSIIKRPKRGFPVPANKWLEGALREWAYHKCRSLVKRMEYDETFVESLFQKKASISSHTADKIWNLVILELWASKWNAKNI